MKMTRKLAFHRALRAGGLLTLAASLLLAGNIAQAHLTYGNGGARDFGIYSGLTNGTKAITNQTCTGNYGWADAADGVDDFHRAVLGVILRPREIDLHGAGCARISQPLGDDAGVAFLNHRGRRIVGRDHGERGRRRGAAAEQLGRLL